MSDEATAAATVDENTSPNGDTPDAPPEASPEAERSDAERQAHATLYQFSTYLHIGPGADQCEDRENGQCNNGLHFHAWCRLPNQFQHSSIREKALAAKARKLRLLRDAESDARVILDEAVEELVRAEKRDALIEEVIQKDFGERYFKAMGEVNEREEFKTIDDDRERLRVLNLKPEDERPQEEYQELEKHLTAYGNALEAAYKEEEAPLRSSLEDRSTQELGDLVREQRVDQEANRAFSVTYAQFEQYIGTLKPKAPDKPGMPSERVFPDINVMLAAAPEIIVGLDQTFQALDAELGRSLKNS